MYTTQEELFTTTVTPIIDEMLDGYNCTLFAYGQTGTGKTHTMEGALDTSPNAGIIPRAVNYIFNFLKERHAEHSVRLSFLELYNEQLGDLMVSAESSTKLRIVEDARKGVFCQNLEEVLVHDADEVFAHLREAVNRRQVAETLMNKASSRSHCVLTVTVHIKETTPDGEDLLKIGKLNLVDLAGSESIGRSGAKDKRAREAGNINQSLLTLGRVITSLVEHHPHVPYRDSKLTRLLQESLGGRQKTCIIATLSPSMLAFDETLSTLEYANRAKCIKNKPEVNQRMTKRALLREYSIEIERLKAELQATREKNGVYMPAEQYEAMQMLTKGQASQLEEIENALKARQAEFDEVKEAFNVTTAELEAVSAELSTTKVALESTSTELKETTEVLVSRTVALEETGLLLHAHVENEKAMATHAESLVGTLDESVNDVQGLWGKIGRKAAVEASNLDAARKFDEAFASRLDAMVARVGEYESQQAARFNGIARMGAEFAARQQGDADAMASSITDAAASARDADAESLKRFDDLAEIARGVWTSTEKDATSRDESMCAGLEEVSNAVAESAASAKATVAATGTDVKDFVAASIAASKAATEAAAQFAAEQRTALEALRDEVTAGTESLRSEIASLKQCLKQYHDDAAAQEEDAKAAMLAAVEAQLDAHFAAAGKRRRQASDEVVKHTDSIAEFAGSNEGRVVEAVATAATDGESYAEARATAHDSFAEEAQASEDTVSKQLDSITGYAGACAEATSDAQAKLAAQSKQWVKAVADAASTGVESVSDMVGHAKAAAAGREEAAEAWSASAVDAVRQSAVTGAAERDALVESATEGRDSSAAMSTGVSEWSGDTRSSVHHFAVNSIREDVSTGTTPARRDYVFRRDAPRTKAQRQLLATYHEARSTEADAAAAAERDLAHTPTPPARRAEVATRTPVTPSTTTSASSVDAETRTLAAAGGAGGSDERQEAALARAADSDAEATGSPKAAAAAETDDIKPIIISDAAVEESGDAASGTVTPIEPSGDAPSVTPSPTGTESSTSTTGGSSVSSQDSAPSRGRSSRLPRPTRAASRSKSRKRVTKKATPPVEDAENVEEPSKTPKRTRSKPRGKKAAAVPEKDTSKLPVRRTSRRRQLAEGN